LVQGSEIRLSGFGFHVSRFTIRVPGSGFRFRVSGFRVSLLFGLGFSMHLEGVLGKDALGGVGREEAPSVVARVPERHLLSGLAFRVTGFGFRAQGLCRRVVSKGCTPPPPSRGIHLPGEREREGARPDFVFRVFEFLISGVGFLVLGFGFLISGFGFLIPGFGFLIPGFGFRFQGPA